MTPTWFVIGIFSVLITQRSALYEALFSKNLSTIALLFTASAIAPVACFYLMNHTLLIYPFIYSFPLQVIALIGFMQLNIEKRPNQKAAAVTFMIVHFWTSAISFIVFIVYTLFSIYLLPPEIQNDMFNHCFPDFHGYTTHDAAPHTVCADINCPVYLYLRRVYFVMGFFLASVWCVAVVRILSYWNLTKKLFD